MQMVKFILSILMILAFSKAMATDSVRDGSDIPSCRGVTDVCMKANVTSTDKKTGKTITGYTFGAHNASGTGLWADCVQPLSKGKPVKGVSGVTKEQAAQCMKDFVASPKS